MTKGVSRHTLAPMHQLASHHYLAGRMNEAMDALEKAIALDLNNPEYHATLGIAHSMNNSLILAKLSFQEAVRLKPRNLNARYNFALCLLNLGETKNAVVEFRPILKKQVVNNSRSIENHKIYQNAF